MADNVAITAGAGTTIAADEATYSGDTSKIQLIKPVFVTGAEGAKTVVEQVGDSEGKPRILSHRDLIKISVQSAGLTTATTAYTAGDQVGNQITLAGAARANGGGGMIVGVSLISAADIIGPFDVAIFDSSVSLAADNAAFLISDADSLKLVALIQLAGAFDIGGNRIAQAQNLAVPYVCDSGGSSLFAALITRATHTWFGAVGDLQLHVYVERN